jgi:hypothetical protein
MRLFRKKVKEVPPVKAIKTTTFKTNKNGFFEIEHDVVEDDHVWQTGTELKLLDEETLQTKDGPEVWVLIRPKHHRDKVAVWVKAEKLL